MSHHLTLYGLKSCDSCRKALRSLKEAGIEVEFVDLRANPPDAAFLDRLVADVGDAAVNRKSTTWRGLSPDDRAGEAVALLAQHPTLIKRPVVERPGGKLSVGWTAEIAAELGA